MYRVVDEDDEAYPSYELTRDLIAYYINTIYKTIDADGRCIINYFCIITSATL